MAPTSPPLRTARASSPAYGSSGGGLSFALGKRFAVAKLRPRLLVASGRLIPSPEIQVSTGKDLLIPRGRAGLEASYRKLLATRFYARPAAYPIGLEASYLSPISPGTLKGEPSLFGSSSAQCGTLPFFGFHPIGFTLFTG